MQSITICTDLFSTVGDRAYSERALGCFLWGLIFANEGYLKQHPRFPALYLTQVRWQREVATPGVTTCNGNGTDQEQFLGVRQVLEQGYADCEDLVCWVTAQRRIGTDRTRRGPPPRPGHPPVTVVECPWPMRPRVNVLPAFFSRLLPGNMLLYHIVIAWPDGYIEDPSRAMGMGGEG